MKYRPRRKAEMFFLRRKGIEAAEFAQIAVRIASDLTAVPVESIFGRCRVHRLCMIRFAVWSIMRGRGYADDEIGCAFRRERSTISFGASKGSELMERHEEFRSFVATLEAEILSQISIGNEREVTMIV